MLLHCYTRRAKTAISVGMFPVATARDRWMAVALAVSAGAFLAAGFLPLTQEMGVALVRHWGEAARNLVWVQCACFTLLALVFHFSVPARTRSKSLGILWRTGWVPVGIAFLYGYLHPAPGLFGLKATEGALAAMAWTLVVAPVGEELLFRGWLYSVANRLWPAKLATLTNPLPLSVWIAALAFSLWHFQNWGMESTTQLFFQVAYTFPLGLWLGWLRWQTGRVLAPVLAHVMINTAASLG